MQVNLSIRQGGVQLVNVEIRTITISLIYFDPHDALVVALRRAFGTHMLKTTAATCGIDQKMPNGAVRLTARRALPRTRTQ